MNMTIDTLSLKGARVENGYTQEQIADKLGVSRVQYINWESGKVVPKDMVIYALAYIYKMDSDKLRVTPKKILP
ncbi:helix-turn-helix transcriptional regulator [Salinicoccus roseus]|uniref:Transcriptional regulator n=1 Tax=Salinicoccus roseus TaxID=45670 RepID=A0A265E6C5_9STAP|nr:helix-turn-helix transcriptional regulator [Salinicoccus roseus]OZT77149.1 transcriptional regulator [Salinicoccus roseus]